MVAYAFGKKGRLWPFSSPLRVLVPRSLSQTSISQPSWIGSVCKETSPQHNLQLSLRALNPKCRERIHHTVLWRATGFFAPYAPLWKSLSSSLVSERVVLGWLPLPCTTRVLRLASSTFCEKANSSFLRMLDPETDRNLWIRLCSPWVIFLTIDFPYVFKELSQEVVKFFRW